jgi:adenylylsulfate kinase-like enzyme
MNNIPAYFLIGYSGVGKTTLGFMLQEYLAKKNITSFVLDNNDMQEFHITSTFGGMDIDSRYKRAMQVTNLINWIKNQGITPIIPAIGQPAKARELWIENIVGYTEIHLICDIETCIKRDNKNIYNTKDSNPKIIGIDIPYEEPENSHVNLNAKDNTPEQLLAQLVGELGI